MYALLLVFAFSHYPSDSVINFRSTVYNPARRKKLNSLVWALRVRSPYDYAFLGMRCVCLQQENSAASS